MLGAMMGGLVADKLGRKKGLILSQVMGVVGGITMPLSRPTMAWEVLLVGRLVVGLTAGLNTVLVPVYVSEIAPLHLRGALGRVQHLRDPRTGPKVYLRQLSSAIKNQLGHLKPPTRGVFCLLLAGSLWHKGAYNRTFLCMEATYPYAIKNQQ